jgi:hypothetical protein
MPLCEILVIPILLSVHFSVQNVGLKEVFYRPVDTNSLYCRQEDTY